MMTAIFNPFSEHPRVPDWLLRSFDLNQFRASLPFWLRGCAW